MTLRRRLTLQIATLLAGVALLGGAGVMGVASLRAELDVALQANEQLRHTFGVGARVSAARAAVAQSPAAAADAADALEQAADVMETFAPRPEGEPGWIAVTASDALAASSAIRTAAADLRGSTTGPAAIDAFAAPYARLADLVAATRAAVSRRKAIADATQHRTIVALASLSAVVMAAAIVVGALLYRGVLRPLNDVRVAARRIASGRFATRAGIGGDEEFAALAGDFNRMAADLQTLYGDLEDRIAAKGRELAQSERLASVGFLAAGVAHEINNPLGIIAGHGERALLRLNRAGDAQASAVAVESLRVICDEAFRCKRITDGLLALARPDGDERRGPVDLARLASDVVATLMTMPAFANRFATVQADAGGDWHVLANEPRLRQVVVNLVLNALEATDPAAGRVRVRLSRPDGGPTVALDVHDDGRGISATSLGRVFEPFYTEKRDGATEDGRSGTGLGLSVAHAIVASLGGTLRASSDGPGRGSTFSVRLPAATAAAGKNGGRW